MTAIDFQALLQASRRAKKTNNHNSPGVPHPRMDDFCYDLSAPFHDGLQLEHFKVGSIESIYYLPGFFSTSTQQKIVSAVDSTVDYFMEQSPEQHQGVGVSILQGCPFSSRPAKRWQPLTRRNLKMYGGVPVPFGGGMIPERLPEWVRTVFVAIEEALGSTLLLQKKGWLNHVLLNEYLNGMGIGGHKDGPLYEDLVFVLNFVGTAVIDFFENIPTTLTELSKTNRESLASITESTPEGKRESLFLDVGSLLIFTGDAYNKYYHEIKDKMEDTIDESIVNSHLTAIPLGTTIPRNPRRLSLTLRHVKHTTPTPPVDSLDLPETSEQRQEMARRELNFYKSISEKQ